MRTTETPIHDRRVWNALPLLVLVMAGGGTASVANAAATPRAAAFVCSRGDGTEDVEPGACARCGAELVAVSRDLTAAVLIFDGVQIIDYCGPYEVFGQARCRTFTVGKTRSPVTTAMGMKVTPAFAFDDCPAADVIIVPGGGVDGTENDDTSIRWLRERAARAQFVLSVCNGAFFLAKTGLLDGLTATTFYDLIDEFETRYPKVKAVRDRRYVDNGKFVTTAGISSGIDGSLHVVGKLRGHSMAQRVALNMEYDWKPHADYARASFADRHIRKIFQRNLGLDVVEGVVPLVVHTEGDRERWEVEWRVAVPLTAEELLARLDRAVAERGGWKRSAAPAQATHGDARTRRTEWKLEERGTEWRGVTEVVAEEKPHRHRVRVRVRRG
jgi:putative intracellular protease/amidase